MTPEEQVARVLAEHAYVPSGLRGVSRCACRMPFHGMPHAHRDHVAAEVVKALGLREERAIVNAFKPGDRWHLRNEVRLVTDWREVES